MHVNRCSRQYVTALVAAATGWSAVASEITGSCRHPAAPALLMTPAARRRRAGAVRAVHRRVGRGVSLLHGAVPHSEPGKNPSINYHFST